MCGPFITHDIAVVRGFNRVGVTCWMSETSAMQGSLVYLFCQLLASLILWFFVFDLITLLHPLWHHKRKLIDAVLLCDVMATSIIVDVKNLYVQLKLGIEKLR